MAVGPVKETGGLKQHGRAIGRSLLLSILGGLVPLPKGPFLRALYFHGVAEDQTKNFASLIEGLTQIGEFINTEALISMLEGRTPLEGRFFHLSFDDGYRNVFQNAAPLLRRLGISPLIFVVTGLVDTDRERAGMERMTWDELRTLQSRGFEVGSHSRTHARFTELPDRDMLEAEIVGSKQDIEKHLGTTCKHIAWPFGGETDVDDRFYEAAVRAGYIGCFGGFRGSVVPGRTSRFHIPRHHLEADWSWAQVRFFACGYGEGRRARSAETAS
jgi:peptidoglycan/xylan/chitin deacetylase (PgdA/CDA1 family)